MRFVIGENANKIYEFFSSRGVIGITYESTLGGLLAYLITFLIAVLAIIGLVTVIKWIIKKLTKPKYKW